MSTDWMSKKAEGELQKFEIAPQGSHLANLVAIIDLGTHTEDYGKGKGEQAQHQIFLVWELCNEIETGTTNKLLVGQKYNFSANPKATLRLLLETWRGRKYAEGEDLNLAKVLGQPCLVNIVHKKSTKGRDYATVAGVSGVPRGMQAVPPSRPLTARGCTEATGLPDWIPYVVGEDPREVIDRCHENRPKGQSPQPQNGKHTSADANIAYPPGPAPGTQQQHIGGTNESQIPF